MNTHAVKPEAAPVGRTFYPNNIILSVSKTGVRRWIFRYKKQGKQTEITLGYVPDLSLSDVLDISLVLKQAIKDGQDPEQRFKAIYGLDDEDTRLTFGEYWETAITEIQTLKGWKNEKHAAQWRSTIVNHALPYLKDKPLEDISRADIVDLLTPIWNKKSETAYRVLGRLKMIFSHALAHGVIPPRENPAQWTDGVNAFLPTPKRNISHFGALSVDELKDFLFKHSANKSITFYACAFIALTATRASEALNLVWDEIDFESATWEIPADRMKMKTPHRVPLSKQALKILSTLKLHSSGDYVFSKRKGAPLALNSLRHYIQKDYADKTTHGLRSTFRDWGENELIDERLLEKALAHQQRSKVVRAYQRDDLLDLRRGVMQKWADEILPLEYL